MIQALGILFALLALGSWGFGDFYIQRTARAIGTWKALFCIAAGGFIVFFPFAFRDLYLLRDEKNLLLLAFLSVITFLVALFNFEALKRGKIAVIEPLLGI